MARRDCKDHPADEDTGPLRALDADRRRIVEAILNRSASREPSARLMDEALALVHVRADRAAALLLTALEHAVVHVLIEDLENWSSVLVFDDSLGCPHLGVFSSEEQAVVAARAYETSYTAMSIDAVLLCKCIDGDLGLAFNSHDEVLSFELGPDIFRLFRAAVAQHGEPSAGRFYSVLSGKSGYQCVRVITAGEGMVSLELSEVGWTVRPRALSMRSLADKPKVCREMSEEAFGRWLPLRILEVIE